MKEFTTNLNYYCIDHQLDDKEFIYDEVAFKAYATINLMSLNSDADYLLFIACINLLNSYVKQDNALLDYRFKSNLIYFLKSCVSNNVDFVKINNCIDDRGKLIVINIHNIQFSFHNPKPVIDNIECIIEDDLEWDGVRKQAIALSIYNKIVDSDLEFSNISYDGGDLNNLVNDFVERFNNKEIDFNILFRGEEMNEELLNRYDKFKDAKLPVPFWDDEREVLEYVYNVDDFINEGESILQVDNSLSNALGVCATASFYYSFTSGYYRLPTLEDDDKEPKLVVGHTHAHSFDEVVESLYDFPESFNIDSSEEEFYSKQELDYLKKVQKYLLFIGLKDCTLKEFDNRDIDRYLNVPNKKYLGLVTTKYTDETIEKIINGELRTRVFESEYIEIYENGFDHEKKVLVTDSEYNIRLCLNFNKTEVKTYKDVKDIYISDTLNEDDKVVVEHFEIVEKF